MLAHSGLMRTLSLTSEEPALGCLGKQDRSRAHWIWRKWEREFVSLLVFPVVEEMKIKSLGENLSLCRINSNSSTIY